MSKRLTNGDSIKAFRQVRGQQHGGFTSGEFATACRISTATLSNIEAGRRQPSFEVLDRIAAVLGVPVEAITYPTNAPERAA